MASNNGQTPIHSTGRGGQGNIGPDPTIYTDGSIVREGYEGPHRGDLEYSTGIGGAGNIDGTHAKHAHTEPFSAGAGANSRLDEDDYVPEPAMREKTDNYNNYHTGRGGQGNVHKDKYGGHSTQKEQNQAERRSSTNTSTTGGGGGGVIDKVKGIIHSHSHHKTEDQS